MKDNLIMKAASFGVQLNTANALPLSTVSLVRDENAFLGVAAGNIQHFGGSVKLKTGDSVILDFGDHLVGRLGFFANAVDRIQDAPLQLKFSFGETMRELDNPESYSGLLSKGWLQIETVNMPFLPAEKLLDRRYTFRYVKIERIDPLSTVVEVSGIHCLATTSADKAALKPINSGDSELDEIYTVAAKTLMDCEQSVYEDGPKRDRRLWIGDFRLQALADYKTFKNYALTKKCMYLFAGHLINDRVVAPCIFENSPPYIDSWSFCDYSLFFISVLYDYMLNGDGDDDILRELYPIAEMQAKAAEGHFDFAEKTADDSFFIDWCPGLNSESACFSVYLYTLRQLKAVAKHLRLDTSFAEKQIVRVSEALLSVYDESSGLFVDKACKLSWAAQIWGVLSGVLGKEQGKAVLKKCAEVDPPLKIGTPYLASYYVESLLSVGMKDGAVAAIKKYWGEMLATGLDRFPEYLITAPERSEFYNDITNSYCHAWAATPAYYIDSLL